MSHLRPQALLDVAEGACAEASQPHLSRCEVCRRRLADVRAALAALSGPDVAGIPEPSPLFWEHLSVRVRRAVAQEPAPDRSVSLWRRRWAWARLALVPACGLAAAGVALMLVLSKGSAVRPAGPAASARQSAVLIRNDAPGPAVEADEDDASLALVADLASQVDVDSALDAGLVEPTNDADALDGTDGLVGALTGDERAELQRLLHHELGQVKAVAPRPGL